MNDFKVGDRVEYVGNVSSVMLGKVGVVVEPPFANSGMVYFDHGGAESYGAYSQSLRLITRTPDVITIDRADLPEVVVTTAGHYLIAGDQRGKHATAEGCRESALISLALAEFLEDREKAAEEAKAAEKEAAEKLNKRRDDVARELAKKAGWDAPESAVYSSHLAETQYAIDMLIAEYDRG